MSLDDLHAWAPTLAAGLMRTVLITVVSMALALVIGLLLALPRIGRTRIAPLSAAARVIVEFLRGTPLILQLFYIFYVFPYFGLRLQPVEAAVLGLGINTGAYLSEVFRAAIEAVEHHQWEAAESMGMRRGLVMRLVILPQAIRVAIPPTGNYFISLFKDSALASTISVSELLFSGQLLASTTFRYIQIYSIIFVVYFIISFPAMVGVRSLERHLGRYSAA
jgi:polar amino acid transport system permease protein